MRRLDVSQYVDESGGERYNLRNFRRGMHVETLTASICSALLVSHVEHRKVATDRPYGQIQLLWPSATALTEIRDLHRKMLALNAQTSGTHSHMPLDRSSALELRR